MNQMNIGNFLKQLRKERGLTQAQLAETLGVSNRSVSRWETGSNLPDLDLLVELAELYDVDLKELLSGERSIEPMNEKLKDTVLQAAEYSTDRYQCFVHRMFVIFCVTIGFALLGTVLQFVPYAPDTTAGHVCEFLQGFGQGTSLGALFLGALITSGKAEKLAAAKRRLAGKNSPQP